MGSTAARVVNAGAARIGILFGVLTIGQLRLLVDTIGTNQPILSVLVGVHVLDSFVIAIGVFSVLRRLLPLQTLARLRYFMHACGTACGLHYVVRLACRLGVRWASNSIVQMNAAAVASGLLITFCIREAMAALFLCLRIDPTKPNPPLGACMAKESLLVCGAEFAAVEVGDTLIYRPKSPRCGLGLGSQFTLLALLAATSSLIRHPPLLVESDGRNGVSARDVVRQEAFAETGAAPLLVGIVASVAFTHMHRLLRRLGVRNRSVLRRAQLFCDSCSSTCWLLGCAAAETACGTYGRPGSGRSFAEIYAASVYPATSQKPLNVSGGTEGRIELWTLVELIEHGLGGATADISAAPGMDQPAVSAMATASCNGPMIALTGYESVDAIGNSQQQKQAGSDAGLSWVTLAPLLVPSVLLPLLFAVIRCDAFNSDTSSASAASGIGPVADTYKGRGIAGWCKRRGPSGLPRGIVVGGFQLLFSVGTQGALVLGSRHPKEWAIVPVAPHLLQLAALATLLLHCAMVCSDPDPVEHKPSTYSDMMDGVNEEDPLEALLREDRRLSAYYSNSGTQLAGNSSCELCGLARGGELRGYHCFYCGRCIALRDHHCEWIGTCVGRNNTGTFIALLCVMWACLVGGCIDLCNGLYILYRGGGTPVAELSSTIAMGVSLLAVGGTVAVYIGWLLLFVLGLWANGITWNEESRGNRSRGRSSAAAGPHKAPQKGTSGRMCARLATCCSKPRWSVRQLGTMLAHCDDTELRGRRL